MNAISDANILLDDIVSTYSDNLWGWPHYRLVGGGCNRLLWVPFSDV